METPPAHPRRLLWPLSIAKTHQGDVTILSPAGRLGTLSSGDLIEAIVTVAKEGGRRLVLDLTGVDYISSAGLLALDAAAARLHLSNGAMVICGVTEPVRLALDLAGLLPDFTIETTLDEALARLSRDGPAAGPRGAPTGD